MKITTPRELWNHPAHRVAGFGKAFAAFVFVLGSFACHRAGVLAPIWDVGKAYWLAAVGLLALTLRPEALRPVYVGVTFLATVIGFVMGHLILVVVYLTLFVTIGYLRRKSSPVTRGFDADAATYWIDRPPPDRPERYYRQY